MYTCLADLATILRQEIDHYRQLLGLFRRERGCIVRGELAGLVELTRRKEAVTKGLAALEASRTGLLERLALECGEDGMTMTLARAAALAPGEHGENLQTLLVEFRGVVGQLVAASDVNRTLLDRSLECVHGSLDLFHSVAGDAPTYGAGARRNATAHTAAVLNQTA